MAGLRFNCGRSDALCPFLFIFGFFFVIIALIIKFSYDSSKVRPQTGRNIAQQPNSRVFEVVLNMADRDECPSYENLFGSPTPSTVPSPMHRLSVSSMDNVSTGHSTPVSVRSAAPSPIPSPIPWLVVPDVDCGLQPPPPSYSECMNNFIVQQHL
ncbi:unnamed protein product [Orchesella dallaii]|uniref:Transmembrane protein n=1 Tax=Orchesella dallaii TaxID=48710 RepID=A0ABP1S952_9HEXA